MKNIRDTLLLNRYFFGWFCILFIMGSIFCLTQGKAAVFLSLNPCHTSALNSFFISCTYLGDGLFTVAIIVILLLIRHYSFALQILTAFLLSGLVVQTIKNTLSAPRPREFFSEHQYAHFIEGVTLHGFASFPSGHSTSVFALATICALCAKNKKRSVLYLFAAIIVGYSRIYLGQHFLEDVLIGSCTGVLTALLVFWFFCEKINSIPLLAERKLA